MTTETKPVPETLTIDQQSRLFELDSLAAVARGKPFESAFWTTTACLALAGNLIETTYTLTEAGRAKLDAGLAKLSDEQRAEFMAKGLKAEFLKGEATT